MNVELTLDREACKRCGLCVRECPFDLVVPGDEEYPELRRAARKRCIRCGHCMAVCPTGALDISISPLAESEPVHRDGLPTPEQFEHLVRTRRSIRYYKDKPLDRAVLQRLLDAARFAPSAHNVQPVHWIMVETTAEVRRLTGIIVDWMDREKIFPGIVRFWEKDVDKVLRGAPHLAVAHARADGMHPAEDTALAVCHMELMAHALGVGACWAGFLIQAAHQCAELRQALELPEGHEVHGALMLGTARMRYPRVPRRDPAKAVWR